MTRKIIYLLVVAAAAMAIWKFMPEKADASGEPMVSVNVPELSATAKAGKLLFDANCAVCHGKNATGVNGSGPPLIHKIYEPGHHGDGSFLIAAKNGVRQHHWRFGNMPPVEGILDADVAKIIVYVRELQKANKIF